MEMTWDWKNFQALFYPRRRAGASAQAAPVYLVVEKDLILAAHCDGEDTSDWVGKRVGQVEQEFAHRERVLYAREPVESGWSDAVGKPHFQDQIEHLRAQVRPEVFGPRGAKKKEEPIPMNRHFLLHALQTWWSKVFPSSYGVFVRLEAQSGPSRDLLVIVRRGRLDAFLEPELTSMGKERAKHPAEVVRYLTERYHVPVQGLIARQEDWDTWSEHRNPWPQVAKALRSDGVRLVPFHWGLASLIGARAFLGL